MSIALYRKYRSGTFSELIGQEHVATTLRNEVRAGRLAHAYLFAGIRGTGKTSTARILARAVNCLDPQDGEPCNRCVACVEILGGGAVDVLEIDAASNRGIDEMRDLREKVKFLPASLRVKVYIIDEAHMLTTEAWNAFLKTLEEPPPHVLFVLATTEPHKVPETVRSRVQRFDFRRVDRAAIGRHLAVIAEKEGAVVAPEAIDLVARSGGGSVRDSLSLLDQALATGERPVGLATVRRALGLADPAAIRELLTALAAGDAAGALRAAGLAFDAGADARQVLREAARLSRAAEMWAVGYPEGADIGEADAALCEELAAAARPGLWVEALDRFGEAEINLRQPVDARLQVELALLRVARSAATPGPGAGAAGPGGSVEALTRRVAALEQELRALSAPPGARTPAERHVLAEAMQGRPVERAPVTPPEAEEDPLAAWRSPGDTDPAAAAGDLGAPAGRGAAAGSGGGDVGASPRDGGAAGPSAGGTGASPRDGGAAGPSAGGIGALPGEGSAAGPSARDTGASPGDGGAAGPSAARPPAPPAGSGDGDAGRGAAGPSRQAAAGGDAVGSGGPTSGARAATEPVAAAAAVSPEPAAPAAAMPSGAGPAAASLEHATVDAPQDLDAWLARWPLVIEAVNRRDPMLAGVLRSCHPIAGDRDHLTVGAPYGFHLERLQDRVKARLLTEAVSELVGAPCSVEAVFSGDEPAGRPGGGGAPGPAPQPSGGVDVTQAALAAFPGSRMTGTRLRDAAHEGGPWTSDPA